MRAVVRFLAILCGILANLTGFSQKDISLLLPVGHEGGINSARYSPDGKFLLTASFDRTAKLWNAFTGDLVADLHDHHASVNDAFYSGDGKHFATISYDSTLIVWNSNTAEKKIILKGHRGDVVSGEFDPAGKRVVTASEDNTARIWDINTGLSKVLQHPRRVNTAAFSPDGSQILTSCADGNGYVWNAMTGRLVYILRRHKGGVASAVFSPDGRIMATASDDATAVLWETATGKLLHTLTGHHEFLGKIFFSPDAKYIATTSADSTIRVWETTTGKPVSILHHHGRVEDAFFTQDGKSLISFAFGKQVYVWDPLSGNEKRRFYSDDFISAINRGNKPSTILISTSRETVLKNIDDGRSLTIYKGRAWEFSDAVLSPDGKKMVCSGDSSIVLWDISHGKTLGTLNHAAGAAFIPHSSSILVRTEDLLEIWDSTLQSRYFQLPVPSKYHHCVLSPDGKYVAIGGNDEGWVIIWEVSTGRSVYLPLQTAGITLLAFTPDSKKLYSGSRDRTLYLLDVLSGKVISGPFTNKNETPSGIAFTQDGRKSAIHYSHDFDDQYNIRLRDEITGTVLFTSQAHSDVISHVLFSPDGDLLLSADVNGIIKVWNTKTGKLVRQLTGQKEALVILETGRNNEICSISYGGRVVRWKWNGEQSASYQLPIRNDAGDIQLALDRATRILNVETQLIELSTGKLIAGFVAIDSVNSLARTPAGYYQSTPGAARALHYVKKDLGVISFDQLDVKFNRPDQVLAQLGNRDTALIRSYYNAYTKRVKRLGIDTAVFKDGIGIPVADFDGGDKIAFEQAGNDIDLRIVASDESFLLKRMNVWVNEVPVFGVNGVAIRGHRFDTLLKVPLSPGRNIIETSVVNVSGLESYRSPLIVNSTAPAPEQRVYFVGIGVNKFQETGHDLQWSVKDIRDLVTAFSEKFPGRIEIDTLFDEQVTVEAIREIKKKLSKTKYSDKVIIAYSGHGLLNDDLEYFLSTYSVDFRNPQRNGIPYVDFESLLDIPARQKLLLIDACHSGEVDKEEMMKLEWHEKSAGDSLAKSNRKPMIADSKMGMKSSFELMQLLFTNVSRSTGAMIISAAAGTQFAFEDGGFRNGVFTYAILEYLRSGEHLTVSGLKGYVNHRVPALTHGLQVPTARSELNLTNWNLW